jgi:hypothetical protein
MAGIPEKLTAEWRWQHAVNFLLGICLIVSPWVLSYADQTAAAWNAAVTGLAIAVVAASTLLAYHEWGERITAVLAAWLLVSPYVLGFNTMIAASWTHFVGGGLVAVLALWSGSTARASGGVASKG